MFLLPSLRFFLTSISISSYLDTCWVLNFKIILLYKNSNFSLKDFKKNGLWYHHHILSMTHFQAAPSMGICRCLETQCVIFTVFWGSKKHDTNNSDLLARAIRLKPQDLPYLNSQLVVLVVFVCLLFVCFSMCVFLWLCVGVGVGVYVLVGSDWCI